MKKTLIASLVLSLSTTAASAAFQDGGAWLPTPQQADAIGKMCSAWEPIASGIYTLKQQGKPKPSPNNPIHAKIIDEIYSERSSVASSEMASSMGYQFCIPIMKRDFQAGRFTLGNGGVVVKHW